MRSENNNILPNLLFMDSNSEHNESIIKYLKSKNFYFLLEHINRYNNHVKNNINHKHLFKILCNRRENDNPLIINNLAALYCNTELKNLSHARRNSSDQFTADQILDASSFLVNFKLNIKSLEKLLLRDIRNHNDNFLPLLLNKQRVLQIAVEIEAERLADLWFSQSINFPMIVKEELRVTIKKPATDEKFINKFYEIIRTVNAEKFLLKRKSNIPQILVKEIKQGINQNSWLSSIFQGTTQRRYFAFRWLCWEAHMSQLDQFSLKQLILLFGFLKIESQHVNQMSQELSSWFHGRALNFNKQYLQQLALHQEQIKKSYLNKWFNQFISGSFNALGDEEINSLFDSETARVLSELLGTGRNILPEKINHTLDVLVKNQIIKPEFATDILVKITKRIIECDIEKIDSWLGLLNHPWFIYLENNKPLIYWEKRNLLYQQFLKNNVEFQTKLKNCDYKEAVVQLNQLVHVKETGQSQEYIHEILTTLQNHCFNKIEAVTRNQQHPIELLQPLEYLIEHAASWSETFKCDDLFKLKDVQALILARQKLPFFYQEFMIAIHQFVKGERWPLCPLSILFIKYQLFSDQQAINLLSKIDLLLNDSKSEVKNTLILLKAVIEQGCNEEILLKLKKLKSEFKPTLASKSSFFTSAEKLHGSPVLNYLEESINLFLSTVDVVRKTLLLRNINIYLKGVTRLSSSQMNLCSESFFNNLKIFKELIVGNADLKITSELKNEILISIDSLVIFSTALKRE